MTWPGFNAEASLYTTQVYQIFRAHPARIGSQVVREQMLWGPGGPPIIGRCTPYCLRCQGATRWCVDASCRWYTASCIPPIPGGWLGGGGLVPGDGGSGITTT